MRESWRPNITEIFWPQSYGRQRCVFHVLHGYSTGPWSKLFGVMAFSTTSRLPPSSTVLLALLLPYLQLSSIRRPYITFKLPRSNIDTPQRLRNLFRFPATGMCHFLPVHHLEWHFWPGQIFGRYIVILSTPLLSGNKCLILNRTVSDRYQQLKPFDWVETIAIQLWKQISSNSFKNEITDLLYTRRCPWCNGYRRRKWTRRLEFKSWTRLIAFHVY